MSASEFGPDRVILGTAQLGMPYGIANKHGRPDEDAAQAIVSTALSQGIFAFDTAQGYGCSEAVLGKALAFIAPVKQPDVITKLSPGLLGEDDTEPMLAASLGRLKRQSLYAVLLHREEHLAFLDGQIGTALAGWKARGLIRHVGVSVYSPAAALRALEHPLISIVQIPASVCDRRFEAAGVFSSADAKDKEIHIRSVFLQGVLALGSGQLTGKLRGLADWLHFYHQHCERHALSPLSVALRWVLRRHLRARVLFGAETPVQVKQNCELLAQDMPCEPAFWQTLDNSPPPQSDSFLNPSLWRT